MRPGRHRAGDAGAQGREIAVGRRETERALKRLQRDTDVGREFSAHPAEVEIDVFDLSLREILRQQAGPEIGRVVERRAPVYRAQPQVMDLDDIAGLGAAYRDGPDDRMRPASGIVLAHLR